MTKDRITEIRERLEAATPGPWWRAYGSEADSDEPVKDKANFLTLALNDDVTPLWLISNGDVIPAVAGDGSNAKDNADLIANAPTDLAYLLAELGSANRRLAAVEAVADEYEDVAAWGVQARIRAALATGERADDGQG